MTHPEHPEPRGRPEFPPNSEWDERLANAGEKLPLSPQSLAYENKWFRVMDRGSYFTIEEPVANVIVLPVVERTHILMLRPYRPILADAPLELPAGKGLQGENPLDTALRELREETGIQIDDTNRLAPRPPLSIAPNRMPQLEWVFQIDLTQDEYDRRGPFDSEIHSLELLGIEKIKQYVKSGEIYVSAVVAALASYIFEISP